MDLAQALLHAKHTTELQAATAKSGKSSKCDCRGECDTHTGPCSGKAMLNSSKCSSCGILAQASYADELEAGGPGSGRHKSGISKEEHDSVQSLRRRGFKYDKKNSVAGTHGYSLTDAKGNHHVVNLSKHGFTHSMASAKSVAKGIPKYKKIASGKHSSLLA